MEWRGKRGDRVKLGGEAQNGLISKQAWCAVGLSGLRTKGSGVEGCRMGMIAIGDGHHRRKRTVHSKRDPGFAVSDSNHPANDVKLENNVHLRLMG
jgi:hypothetical protein